MIKSNQVRPFKVLELKAILMMDGSDDLTQNIAGMSKVDQLEYILKTRKTPEDGLTLAELAWIFYGSSKDFRNMQKLKEHNEELVKWTPSMQQADNMRQLIANHRKDKIKKDGTLYYSFSIPMPDFNNEKRNILQRLNTVKKYQDVREKLTDESEGIITREGYLKEREMRLQKVKTKNGKKILGNTKNSINGENN